MWPQPLLLLLLLVASTPEDQAAPISVPEHAHGHNHAPGGPDTSEGPELGPLGLLGIHSLLRSLNRLLLREDLLRGVDSLMTPSVDFRSLPPNYHNEDQKQHHLGNSTVYSHHQIDKVTDNRTGDVMISEKMVAAIEPSEGNVEDDWKAPEDEENEPPQPLPNSGLSSSHAEAQPRVSFWIVRLPHRMARAESRAGSRWLSEKRHRLQAIRDGLREGAHEEAPLHLHPVPRRAHFLYLLRPPQQL
ncbi:dickkopf-like protein 1 [Trichosurus vulpecula]|uniref:dickkopf-like protein 1 n=1 Tax=Trichosurus vulpecula TaxID=9337 RepID=UPI00186AC51E|nr:dickkopf-like protein 1 [Trichosurus vulpecula]XP_036603657.1 dickkopf-like protein 1 [Trichosurus vulpecula]XP_036603658.1 dickkopf-like protein 1 [Trichosurus vulpecula]